MRAMKNHKIAAKRHLEIHNVYEKGQNNHKVTQNHKKRVTMKSVCLDPVE